jgi:DNA polymerase-1
VTLLPHHRERLEMASGIAPEVTSSRGYYSVESRDELKGLGFPRDIGKCLPALAIPGWPVKHLEPGEKLEPAGLVLRLDQPYTFKDGRVAKYLSGTGQRNMLDANPIARAWLPDVLVPLVVTEGTIKADAAVSAGLAAIGLGGVDGGWRNGAPLDEWQLLPLKGRTVLVTFDSDVTRKASVRNALHRLAGYLQKRGAQVEIVMLPPGAHGEKVGLDDFLVAHRGSSHPVGLLLELAVAVDGIPDDVGEPTPELPNDMTGADVLDRTAGFVSRFVHFSNDEERWAVALWTAHTHLLHWFDICAYLGVRSAIRESGKSRLLEILTLLVRHGEYLLEPSDASVFRLLAEDPPPVLLIDELDQTLRSADDRHSLVGLLNAGFTRGATVPRVEDGKDGRTVVRFPVFGPKAFASIGRVLPDTTSSRTIFVDLKRRTRDEPVERWRVRRSSAEAREVHALLAGWAATLGDDAGELELDDLDFLSDRQADIWEPLRVVANLAGGAWPGRATAAARKLSSRGRADDGLALELLRDVRVVFAEQGDPEAVKSGALAKALNALEDSQWSSLRDGRGLTAHRLARELLGFDLRPEQRRDLAGDMLRGWWRTSLEPVWERYLDDVQEDVESPDLPSSRDQSGSTGTDADFPLNQAKTSESQTGTEDGSCTSLKTADFGSAMRVVPVEPVRTREKGENAESTSTTTVVEEHLAAGAEGASATLEVGTGGPLQAHRLPPEATGEGRERLRRFIAAAARRQATLAVDCETTGSDPYGPGFEVRIWSVSDGAEAWALDARDARSVGQLAADLARYPGPLAIHNVTFDVPVAVRELGLDAGSFTDRARSGQLIDTMILARLNHPDERRVGLKETAKLVLGSDAAAAEERLKLAFKHLRGDAAEKWRQVDPAHPAYWQYAAVDAALTARLHERLGAHVDDDLVGKEMRVAMICLRAGLRGWPVDPDAAATLERDLAGERDRLERALRAVGVTSVTTTAGRAAIVEALGREGHPPTGKGLAREVLEPLALAGSQVARDVLALRTTLKFLSLYVPMFLNAADRDGRLHAFPLTLATVTGRMALPGVPLQTAPKGELELASENGTLTAAIRSALVAGDDHVTASVDFQTMELRIAAALSGDARLCAVVEAGDAHTAVARRLFDTDTPTGKQRAVAKTTNFGLLYGMGAEGLASRLRISEEQARAFAKRWWEAFPAVRKLRERLASEERRTLWGRRLPADDVPEHIALNHVIQGYGRDVFAAGLLALEDAGLDQYLLLPMHDEYVLRLPDDWAGEYAADVADCVRSRLAEVELPVEATVGAGAWSTLTEAHR